MVKTCFMEHNHMLPMDICCGLGENSLPRLIGIDIIGRFGLIGGSASLGVGFGVSET